MKPSGACLLLAAFAAGSFAAAPPAAANWRPARATIASIAYNQGITVDRQHAEVFFAGVTSTTNSGLYRTNAKLVQTAANTAVLPATPAGYNHIGDLGFDPRRRRLVLPLECYYPSLGGNTCGVGAFGVADPVSLRLQYLVSLDTAQIAKAMWAEVSPDGRWIWTSSGTHLLAYRAADVNRVTADAQRAGTRGGIRGDDLGAVLPTGSVTGATFYEDATTHGLRLFLALNEGARSTVISFGITGGARPRLSSAMARTEITRVQSPSDNESEGLATTGPGALRWLMLPQITSSTLYSRILSYSAMPRPPRDDIRVQPGQRLRPALAHGLKLTVVCNERCTASAVATVGRRVVGTGALGAGSGSRTLTITFRPAAARALSCRPAVTLSIVARSRDLSTRMARHVRLATTLR